MQALAIWQVVQLVAAVPEIAVLLIDRLAEALTDALFG